MKAVTILRVLLVTVATVAALAVAVLSTFATVRAGSDPQTALARWPADRAKAAVAAELLANAPTPEQVARAIDLSSQALRHSPVNVVAARDLAMGWLMRGDEARARHIILLGEGLSRRDVAIQTWLIEDRVQANDIVGALAHYDRALRTDVASRKALLSVLAPAANDPAIAGPLAPRLTARPGWWSDFLGQFIVNATNPQAILTIAQGLRLDPTVPVDRDRISQILLRLVALGDFGAARRYHAKVTGRTAAVTDGGFDHDLGIAPFDWQLQDESDGSATREKRDGSHGMALSIDGTQGKVVARQLLALKPGSYRLQATVGVVGKDMSTPPALSLTCATVASGETALMTSSVSTGDAPHSWTMMFNVPAQGCAGQWLSIRSATKAGYLNDQPWIDDVGIALAG